MEILQDSADSRCKFQYANKRDATKKVSTSYFKDLCVKKETFLELAIDQAFDVPSIIFFHNFLQNSLQKSFQFFFYFFFIKLQK